MSQYAKEHRKRLAKRTHLDKRAIQFLWNSGFVK